jgi:DNA polymerase III, epsilon subunit and related 3''-5'' exonucleases
MKVVILDTETTGTDHENDQIIELAHILMPGTPQGLIEIKAAEEMPFYHERFLPSVAIKLGAQAVHNILLGDLNDCAPSESIDIAAHNIDILIGHNIDFDWRMLGQPDIPRICTLALSRFMFPEVDSHTQSAMLYMIAREYGAEERMRAMLKDAHAALDDVRNCSVLLRYLLRHAAKSGHNVASWEAVHALSEIARIPTIMGFGKHKGTAIEPGQLDASYVQWYRRQAETDPYYIEAFKRAGF